jgi:hypothetical protein
MRAHCDAETPLSRVAYLFFVKLNSHAVREEIKDNKNQENERGSDHRAAIRVFSC